MGLKGAWNRYGRFEARLIVAKLMVRASDPDVVQRLLGATPASPRDRERGIGLARGNWPAGCAVSRRHVPGS